MLKWKTVAGLAVAGAIAACGMLKKEDKDERGNKKIKNEDDRGCIQGVVRNGITGERVSLDKGKEKNKGIFVLVRNRMIEASTVVENSKKQKQKDLLGEYYLCGFPLDETFPLFVWQDGYQNFEGKIMVSSTIAQKTKNSQQADISRRFPTLMADIDIFPVGTQTKDLKFIVYFQGERAKGATVQLQPTQKNVIGDTPVHGPMLAESPPSSEHFDRTSNGDMYDRLTPQIRLQPLSQTTDKNGEAIFPAAQLVLGGVYQYLVIPGDGGTKAAQSSGIISVGFRGVGTSLNSQPYEVSVRLDNNPSAPRVVSSSLDKAAYHEEGNIVLHFDQKIELNPESSENARATLISSHGAQLKTGRESLNVKVDGNTLTLSPNFHINPDEDVEPSLIIQYSNIAVRSKGAKDSDSSAPVSPSLLKVYYYDNAPAGSPSP